MLQTKSRKPRGKVLDCKDNNELKSLSQIKAALTKREGHQKTAFFWRGLFAENVTQSSCQTDDRIVLSLDSPTIYHLK